mgnify:CR=1 FL=1
MEEDKGQILLYQTPDGESHIEVRLQGETVWLSLDQMAELFQRNKSTISRHIKNVFEERAAIRCNCCVFCNSSNRRKKKSGTRHCLL